MKRFGIIVGLLLSTVVALAQTTLVGGTSFNQKEGYSDWGWDFSTVSQIGPAGNTLAANLTYLEDGNSIKNGGHWVCVDNPFKLGTNESDETSIYVDEDDAMFVTNLTATPCTKLFSYTINGLKPGSQYRVTMRVWVVSTATPSIGYFGGLTVGVNLNQYMQAPDGSGGVAKSLEGNSLATGTYQDVEFSGTLTSSQTSMVISMMEGYNMSTNTVIGISDIKVYGTINPKILSGQGSEMCRGEQTLLTLDRDYGRDATIKWERSTNGSSWSLVSTRASMYDEVTEQKMYYRATVNGTMTETYEVTTVTCCETIVDNVPVYSSRETIFYEDFGYFTDTHEYVDAEGNKSTTPSNYYPYRNNVSWTMPSTAGSFAPNGDPLSGVERPDQIGDGSYGVIVPTGIGYCTDANCNSTANWMIGNGAITSDHSSMINGIPNSACLFMNVKMGFKGTIFSRTITGLCTGKALSFECYVGNMSAGTNPVITLSIKTLGGTVLAKRENVEIGVGTGWNRISIDDLILTESDIVVEVQSWGENWSQGQDICFDDIKIMACSSPALDLFSDVNNLERATYVCSDPFTLGSVASNLLKSYYGSTLQYLFQYSKDNGNSWVDITRSSSSSYTIQNPSESQIFDGMRTGESVQFRVIAATASTLASTSSFSTTNYCKNYSISPSVEAIFDCPTCSKPKKLIISTNTDVLCPGESTVLKVSEQDDATTYSYTWYKGTVADGEIVAGPTTAKTLPLTVSHAGEEATDTYTVLVRDVNFPTLVACQRQSDVEIMSNATPTLSISGSGNICKGETLTTPVKFTATGEAGFTVFYKENAIEKEVEIDGYETTLDVPTIEGTYVYTLSKIVDDNGCVNTNVSGSATVTIKPIPSATIGADKVQVCEGETITLSASSDQVDASFTWTGPGITTGNKNASSVTLTNPNQTGSYKLTASLNNCTSPVDTKTVTINEKPEITKIVADKEAVCSGKEITLTATVTDAVGGGTYTWSGTGVTGTGNTATVTNTVTEDTPVTVTLNYKSAAGCEAESMSKTVTFYAIPSAPSVTSVSYCDNASQSDVDALTATASAGGKLYWYGKNSTGGTRSESAPTPLLSDGTTTYYVSQEVNGCESERAPLTVTIKAGLEPDINIVKNELCPGETTKISTQDFETVTWKDLSGGTYNDLTLKAPTFTAGNVTQTKTYEIQVDVESNGCTGSNTATITVYPTPIVELSDPAAVCSGESTSLTATVTSTPSTGGTYTWSTNVSGTSETSATYGETESGTVTYDYMSVKGCKAVQASKDVTIKPTPSAPTTKAFSKCRNTASESLDNYVTKASGATLLWYGTTGTGTGSATAPTPSTASPVDGELYYVSQVVDGCESTEKATVSVTVLDKLYPEITTTETSGTTANDGVVCAGIPIAITLSDTYVSAEWTGTGATYLSATDIQSPTFKGTAPAGDAYALHVVVTDDAGCTGETDVTIQVKPVPEATLSAATAKCADDATAQTITATVTPSGLSGTGTWTGDVTKVTETTATFTPKTAGAGSHTWTYSFMSTDGCEMLSPVSGGVEVYAMPEITIKPSVSAICESGENSGDVTITMTGTYASTGAETPTYSYTSATLTGVDATTGKFNSVGQSSQTHTIALSFTDANGCAGSAETTVKVNARPVSDITMNPAAICDYAEPITLEAKVNGNTVTTGTFSGTGVSGATFTPSFQIKGANTITFNYTDDNGCTAEEESHTITVNHTDVPSVTSAASSKLDVTNQTTVPALTATGDNIKWYLANDTTSAVAGTGASYQVSYVDDGGNMAVGTYTAYATQTVNGCQSVPQEVTLTITDCKAKAPSASVFHACVNASDDLEITATSNQDGAENFIWFEDRTKVPTQTYASLSAAQSAPGVVASGATYTVNKSQFTEDKTITMYVSEYYATDECFSAATAVEVKVHALPEPTITVPANICSTVGEITVQYGPTTAGSVTSTLTAEAGTISDNSKWSIAFDDTKTGTTSTNLTVTTDEVWGSGTAQEMTCENQKTESFVVTHVLAPEGTGIGSPQVWSASKLDALPSMTVTYASDLGATLSVKDASNTEIGTASGIDMKPYITDKGEYSYTVTQTLNTCPASSVSNWSIVECPTPAPNPQSVEICAGQDGLPTIAANGTGAAFKWYDESNTEIAGQTGATLNVATLGAPYASTRDMAKTVYTFSVSQDGDDGAGGRCYGPTAAVTVTVNPLPVVEIGTVGDMVDGKDVLCYAGGKKTAEAMVNGTSSSLLSGGVWTIDDASAGITEDGVIDPTFKDKVDGTYTVKYVFTDVKGCINEDTQEITVEYPEVPTTTDFIGITVDPKPVMLSASDVETKTGTKVNWYQSASSTALLSSDNPWTTDDDPETEVEKSYYVSETVYGCESERKEQKIQIVNCPWAAPAVESATVCQNEPTIPAMKATAESGATVQAWAWNGTETSSSDTEVTHSQSGNATAGITTYKVRYKAYEPVSGVYCWSPEATVTTTVYGLPVITFDKTSEDVCYTDGSVEIEVTATPGDNGAGVSNGVGSGKWTSANDAVSSSDIFNTKANGEQTGTYELKYTYTDGQGCVNDETRTITVTYLPKPETEGFYAMTSQTNPVTVKVTSALESGAVAQWFSSETSTMTKVGEGKSFMTGDDVSKTVEKSYYARQYSAAGGCYSEATSALVKIVPCPIPQVVISDEESCDYEEVPTLSASTGDWSERDGSKSTYRFYRVSTGGSVEKESSDGNYQPSLTEKGEYSYYVSEYNSVPLEGLTTVEGCEGPRKSVKITIKGTDKPTVTPPSPEVCAGETNPMFTATYGTGEIGWYEEDPGAKGVPESSQKGSRSTFIPNGREAGEYSVWAVLYNNGCYGEKTEVKYTIKAIPEAPSVTDVEICYGEPNVALTASGSGTINWYTNASKGELLNTGEGYLSRETSSATYTYYAAQRVKGCEGPTAAAKFTIKPLPSAPVMTAQPNICEYAEAPILHASGENITWYASDKTTNIGMGESFQTTDMSADVKRYFATQTVKGCEGPAAMLTYTVNPKPSNPTVTGASVCEGGVVMPSLSTNMSLDKWYADESAVTYLSTGYTYTPDYSEVGSRDKTYYVQRELNGCVSDVMPVLLHVVPKPNFSISGDTTLCVYDDVVTLEATKFNPAMNNASTVNWEVKKANVVRYFDDEEGHTLTPTSMITSEGEYVVSATYKYVYDNIYCVSDTVKMKYTVKGRARKPIVFSSVICQGEEIKDLQALGSPKMVWMSQDGTLPVHTTGPSYKFQPGQVLDTGTYRFIIYDRNVYDAANDLGCDSEIDTVSLTVAPAAKTKLFGKDSVCVNANEQYYTQFTKESSYFWNVTGDHLNYSKDAGSSSVRYVDWMKSGVDTLTVYEQTWAGCEGFDTLIVRIAARPKPSYSWTMPGASNIIELQDSTIQDSLWYKGKDGEMVGEPIPYTMYWNYGHQGESEDIVDTVINYSNRLLPIQEGDYIHGYNCPILTVENSFGCKEVYKDCIFLELTSSLYVPSAFAPMNPAHSVRTFQPKGYNLKTCEISVYDKWGNLLWYSDAVEDGKFVGYWDGRYDGKMMQSDVYIWKMEATFLDGLPWDGFDVGNGKKAKFGSVTLIR